MVEYCVVMMPQIEDSTRHNRKIEKMSVENRCGSISIPESGTQNSLPSIIRFVNAELRREDQSELLCDG